MRSFQKSRGNLGMRGLSVIAALVALFSSLIVILSLGSVYSNLNLKLLCSEWFCELEERFSR